MHNIYYQTLVTEFCSLVGLEKELGTVLKTGSLVCGDVAFTLLALVEQKNTIAVYVDFGEVPSHSTMPIYQRLLEINLLIPLLQNARLGLDPETGRVVFAFQFNEGSAERLLICLEMATQQAHEWRTHFFLDKTLDSSLLWTAHAVHA